MAESRRRTFIVTVGVALAILVVARGLTPFLLSGPPAGGGAWVAWLAVVAPWAGALGAAAAVHYEGRALGDRWRDRWVATAAAWLVGLGGALILLTPLADASPLFPVATVSDSWEAVGSALVDREHGVRVDPDGSIKLGFDTAETVSAARDPDALTAIVAVLSLGLWAPLSVMVPGPQGAKVAAHTVSIGLTVITFHAVAAGFSELWIPLVGAPLVSSTCVLAWRTHARGPRGAS